MLENEKYKGDTILQKNYTTDFLIKKRVQNQGGNPAVLYEDDHEAIIEKWIWECVQLEIERRKRYLKEHGTNSFAWDTETNPFAVKIVCGECNKDFQFHVSAYGNAHQNIVQCHTAYKSSD